MSRIDDRGLRSELTISRSARPFCFMSLFWGRRYRDYFVDYCLPSLLAPGNLPLLSAADGHCFLIATPREDWESIESLPIMARLRNFATPTLIETPPPGDTSYASILKHQTFSLKRLFQGAYERNAYGCAVWPDTMMSDGFVAAMRRWVEAGHHLVMQPTVRLNEEGVLSELRAEKLLPEHNALSLTAEPIIIPARVVAQLSVRHLHREMEVMEEGHTKQPLHPPYRFWRVPNGRGLILHVFFATPVLMDFAVVPPNHADCLDIGDWETFYVGQNFSHCGGLHVVADSDESGILSITPANVDRSDPNPVRRFGHYWAPHLALLCNLRQSIAVHTREQHNIVRRDMFRVSVRWHTEDIDEVWLGQEAQIRRVIERAAGDYYALGDHFPVKKISVDPRYLPLDLVIEWPTFYGILRANLHTLLRALLGNKEDLARLRRKIFALFHIE
jgi:hypothetical protein